MNSHEWRVSILALLIAFPGCSGKKEDAGAPGSASAQEETPVIASGEKLPTAQVKDLGKIVDIIVAESADLPRAEFDPAALAAKLGKNPQAHFEWVRDNTWWVPYRGLLRGSRGVLLDRVGSNLDRSVLLGDLLRRSGHTVRLARAQLPESLARQLLTSLPLIPDRRRNTAAAYEPSAKRLRAAEAIVPGLAKTLQQQSVESRQRIEKGAALVRSQTEQLYAAVSDAAAEDTDMADQAVIAALRDHWWVEIEDNGKWIAMDILKPDAKPGDALSIAAQTSDWSATSDAPSIPETEWHTVQIRVVVERYLAGNTSESTLLETTLRPAEVFDTPIALLHHPKPWPDTPASLTTNPNALRDAALNVKVWTPVLRIGDHFVSQAGFTDSADIKANPFDPIADLGGGGLFGGLDSALGGGEEYEPYASAEWIDYEIRVPGEPSQRLRRQVFDLLGPGRRLAKYTEFNASTEERRLERSEALLSRTDILLQPCEFTEEFVAHLTMSGIVAQQAAIREFARERDDEKRKSIGSAIFKRMQVWGPVLAFASWRSVLGNQHGDWFIGRPNVISHVIGRRLTGTEQPVTWQMIDLAANATDVRRGATKNAFEARLERGVADTVAEMLTLAKDLNKAENTAAIFDTAGGGQSSGAFIAPRDMTAVTELGWPEDETARIAEDINAGFMVVALRQPVELRGVQRVGWWRVHPASGETIGVMDTGFHVTATEENIQMIKTMDTIIAYHDGIDAGVNVYLFLVGPAMAVGSLALALYCGTYGCGSAP